MRGEVHAQRAEADHEEAEGHGGMQAHEPLDGEAEQAAEEAAGAFEDE